MKAYLRDAVLESSEAQPLPAQNHQVGGSARFSKAKPQIVGIFVDERSSTGGVYPSASKPPFGTTAKAREVQRHQSSSQFFFMSIASGSRGTDFLD